jgi:predicted RNA-binding protein YlxR (DUF448 family)
VTSTTELVRVVALVDGTLAVGRGLHGRGAWLCAGSSGCFDLAVRRGAFARSFRRPIGDAAIANLRRSLDV